MPLPAFRHSRLARAKTSRADAVHESAETLALMARRRSTKIAHFDRTWADRAPRSTR